MKVGDVVLRKGKTEAGQTYKYVRVLKVHEGLNGKVRSADVEYKVPGESKLQQLITIRGKCIPVTDGSTEERGVFTAPQEG